MAPRHILGEHVRSDPGFGGRIADAISVDTWRSSSYAISGYEVKTSRSDWLRELQTPHKCDEWRRYCAHWWLVTLPGGVVRDDLPDGWGLLVRHGDTLRQVVKAPTFVRPPLPASHLAGLARAIQNTTLRRAS